ncbi:sulfatase [Bremerella alba]|nr:sulfatase [Bremerella alba]
MNKTSTTVCLAFVVFLLGLPLANGADSRPNVLFIMVDDLRPELGCYGSPYVQSPNIDSLATQGLVFKRAYCQQAHCRPSRYSLLSGLRPDSAGIWTKEDVRPALADTPLLPDYFKQHGYYCVGIGKIAHNNEEDPACWSEPHSMPQNYRFEYRTRAGRAMVDQMQRQASEAGLPNPFEGVSESKRRGMPYECLDVADNELSDGQIADEAIAALKRLQDRPFFLGLGFLRPHLPFVAPRHYWDLYDPEQLPTVDPTAAHDGIPKLSSANSSELRKQYRNVPAEGNLPDELNRNLWHGYLASVSYVDAQIGRVLDTLNRLGLADNTIVVIAGDHGFSLGELGLWGKATNFESATRTTLIIYSPGMKASSESTESLVELVGLYPTLCDLARIPKPNHLQGKSFSTLLDVPDRATSDCAISQYGRGDNMGRSIRTERYRLVEWRHRESGKLVGRELYDHENDPNETTNLCESTEHNGTRDSLPEKLHEVTPHRRAGDQ